jgi:hypothetical protein
MKPETLTLFASSATGEQLDPRRKKRGPVGSKLGVSLRRVSVEFSVGFFGRAKLTSPSLGNSNLELRI